jgi:tetratricopeptide (TPR) repeat protein
VTSGQESQRKRGIRASRARLTHALTAAGLRTQAALAERIADLEGLESAPRDLVNRAFRELPVELQSLERIGRALGVEAWTLYRTADEDELPTATTSEDDPPGRLPLMAAAAAGAAALVAVIAGAWWLAVRGPEQPAAPGTAVSLPLTLGAPTLVVLPIDGDSGDLAAALRSALGEEFSVADAGASVVTGGMAPAEAAATLRTDIAVDGAIVTVGRFAGIRFHALSGGVRRPFWAESLPRVALSAEVDAIAARAVDALLLATDGGTPAALPARHFPLPPVQDDYLEGRLHLDHPANELNIRRAQGRFESALRQDANYARAHAGLCAALLEEYWMADEERALKDAARTCGQALQLDPEDPVVKVAHARFLARTGRNEEAITLYEQVIADHPRDSDALAGLADSRLQAWRQTGDASDLTAAMALARAAADADPAVWKPLFALATMHWFAGDLDGAIAASEEAIARDRNEYVLANLGTWYVCAGDFVKARDAYLAARELAPQSYVGDEFLGMVYYFLQDFARSAEARRKAIQAIATGEPEIHEMWGNLADAYRQAGDSEAAVDAYLRAAAILERDHLRGTAPEADRAKRAYYYLRLESLAPDRVPPQILVQLRSELDEIAAAQTEAAAHRRMAEIWLLTGEQEKARQELALATATCPGYADLPDLAALK